MTQIFTKMFRHNLLSAIFIIFSISTAFAQLPLNDKVTTDSTFNKVFREGDLSKIQGEVKNRSDLQLERLTAYFFHQRINQYRLENKLTTLYWDDKMWLAARNHNLFMTIAPKIGHIEQIGAKFFTGIKPSNRILYVTYNGFSVKLYGENCLLNFSADSLISLEENAKNIAEKSFEQWKQSPPHNLNMLNRDFFAHGTSFVVVEGGKVYGTTNFGNASDFIEQEISIDWDTELAKEFSPSYKINGQKFKEYEWNLKNDESKALAILKEKMPSSNLTLDKNMQKIAMQHILYQQANNTFTTTEKRNGNNYAGKTTASRYLKVTKYKSAFYLFFNKLRERSFVFTFTLDELKNKSSFSKMEILISKELPPSNSIKNWGAASSITKRNDKYECIVDVVYVTI